MKLSTLSLLILSTALVACGQTPTNMAEKDDAVKLETPEQKVSYAIGFQNSKDLPTELENIIDADALTAGLRDGMAKKSSRVSEADLNAASDTVFKPLQEKMQKTQEAAKAEGIAFLEKNGKEAGVTTTKSGLQYQVLTKADGKQAKATDTVTVNYKGTLVNGTEFDSSYTRGQPATFPLNAVIKGWQEGIPLMKVGEKYKFVIPSDLAYGSQSPSAIIPPDSTLVFEVELLNIQ